LSGAALVGSSRCDDRTPQRGIPTNVTEGDDGLVLKFKRWDDAQIHWNCSSIGKKFTDG
jgi:hypothetical protein